MELFLQFDKKQLNRLWREFDNMPREARRALVSSLNRTIIGVRTDTKRQVSKAYFVKVSDASRTMSIIKAGPKHLQATLRSEGNVIPLIDFRVSPKRPTNPPPKGGIKVKVKRNGAAHILKHAFIAEMWNGHVGVFERERKSSLPIHQLFSAAIPSMVKDPKTLAEIQKSAFDRLGKALDHEIDRILKGYGS